MVLTLKDIPAFDASKTSSKQDAYNVGWVAGAEAQFNYDLLYGNGVPLTVLYTVGGVAIILFFALT